MRERTILVLSLTLNLGLLAGWYFSTRTPVAESSPESVVVEGSNETVTVKTNVVVRRQYFSWQEVESPDYPTYIANLKDIGCPDQTIRDIIVADVNKLYAAKKREARGEPKKFEYWKAGNPWMGQLDADYMANTRALEEEKLNVLRQLGIEPDAKMQMSSLIDPSDALGSMFGFLPEEKQVSVMKIMQDMQTEMAEAAGDGAGFDAEAMLEAQRKTEEAIKAVLSPEQFRDYELRMSMTANTMRNQLAGWDPDEQAFLQVYDLRKTFDDEFSMLSRGNETDAERQRRQEAEAQLNETIKQALGDQQYEAYERAQDWNFQQIHQAANRADLGTSEAIQVYDMRQVAEDEARNVRDNQELTLEERNAALQGIQAETERSIKQVLGDEGWEQYNRGANTYWLRNMTPRQPSTGTTE